MNTERICPSCRKPLPPESVQELCPECLMKAGFESVAGQPGASPRFVPPPLEELARLFPDLEILELIGQGGMGAVYRARQSGLDRLVAVKILPPEKTSDPGFAERFVREAKALARLNHPNIVSVYHFGVAGGLHHFVMEYVEGVNLRQLVRAGHLSPAEALKLIPQICDALQFAHDEGIVHRDIKPENIMVDRKGRVKITDFGLAKLLGQEVEALRLTGAKEVMGTPNYMAPEQIEHPQAVDHRADIYSLGVVFYELLTGELPIGKFAPPSRKVEVDVRLDDVVLHTLEKEPDRRYQHASQVKTDLVTIAEAPRGSAPAGDAEMLAEQAVFEAARDQVKGPATGLIVIGVLNWVLISLIGTVGLLLERSRMSTFLTFLLPLLALFLSSVVLIAGLKMKRLQNYRLAILGSILAIITTPGNLLGLPIGIWSLVVLSQKDVRSMFGKELPPRPVVTPAPAGSGGGVAWKVALVAIAAVMLLGALVVGGALLTSIAMPAFQRAREKARQTAVAFESQVSLASLSLLEQGQGRHLLDLDSGQAVAWPSQFNVWSRDRKQEWLREHGIDLMLMGSSIQQWSFLTPVDNPVTLVKVPPGAWDQKRGFLETALLEGPPLKGEALQLLDPGLELIQMPLEGHNFAFRTTDGAIGLIKIIALDLGNGDEAIGLKLRFKRFAGGAELQVRQASATFGTPTAVVINDLDERRGSEALDLDTGRVLDIPEDLKSRSEPERQSWFKQNGADVLIGRTGRERPHWILVTSGENELALTPTVDDEWTHDRFVVPPPMAVRATVAETLRQNGWVYYVLATNTPPPVSFRFATAQGQKGLLQITDFGLEPDYAKLRFKLLQATE